MTDDRFAGRAPATPGRLGRYAAPLVGLVAALLIAAFFVGLDRNGLLWEAPDRITYDWRTYLFTERAGKTRDDIAVIRVNEDSLTGYAYLSPIDRGLTTELVRQVADAGAAAIGLDLILDRLTEAAKDTAMIAALREVNARVPIVVGAVDGRSGGLSAAPAFQERLIAETGVRGGHIYFAAEKNRLSLGDQAVRYIVPPSLEPPARPAFSQALADAVGKGFEPASPLIYWRHPPKVAGAHFVPTFTVPAHRDVAGKPLGPVLPESWSGSLKGKIVLIGGAFSDRDLHLTPLSVATDARVHGIEIHAQMLAQRLDRRSVYLMNWWQEFLLVALVAGLGFFATQYWRVSGDGWKTSGVAFLIFVGASFGLFAAFAFILPTATLFFAWPTGLFAGRNTEWFTGI